MVDSTCGCGLDNVAFKLEKTLSADDRWLDDAVVTNLKRELGKRVDDRIVQIFGSMERAKELFPYYDYKTKYVLLNESDFLTDKETFAIDTIVKFVHVDGDNHKHQLRIVIDGNLRALECMTCVCRFWFINRNDFRSFFGYGG